MEKGKKTIQVTAMGNLDLVFLETSEGPNRAHLRFVLGCGEELEYLPTLVPCLRCSQG